MTRGRVGILGTLALMGTVAFGSIIAAGCGGSTVPSGSTPATSTTPSSSATTTSPPQPPRPAAAGTAAAGKVVFRENCDTCHAGLGTRAYVGPRLAGLGLSATKIRTTIIQGKTPMPAGLVDGQDLADVVAYVKSLE